MASWDELNVSAGDWAKAETRDLVSKLTLMQAIRSFENTAVQLWADGLVNGPVHASVGQEACAAGIASVFRPGDLVTYPHRGHHHFLSKALHRIGQPQGFDIDGAGRAIVKRTLAEIMGLEQGWCRGRGGSMHLYWRDAGILGSNAIIGAGMPHAVGMAEALRRKGSQNIVVGYLGDGALQQAGSLEAISLAATFDVPLCIVVENNLYAVATHISEAVRETRLSSRGLSFGIPAMTTDGMDVVAVSTAMQEAADLLRAGKGPFLLELRTYRYLHQNGPMSGSAFGYRTKEEEEEWRKRDCIERVRVELARRNDVDHGELAGLERAMDTMMRSIVDELVEGEGESRRIIPTLWPKPEEVDHGSRGDLSEFSDARYLEEEAYAGNIGEQRFSETIAMTLAHNMTQDPRILIMGEDIQHLRGGTNGATKGLVDAFPGRVIGTPIAELGFLGMACGMAIEGSLRPIVEFMYADFIWVAADQIINQVGKARQMYGGHDPVPLVLRTKIAIGTGYGSQHSMDPAGFFTTSPGWRIVAPRTPFDYVGLMNSAIRCNDPVLVLEHVENYTRKAAYPSDDLDFCIPLGKAKIVRPGSALTAISYLTMVDKAVSACDEVDVDAEVIDLRSLDRAGIDWETIGASIRKTNNAVLIEEGPLCTSYGTMLADDIQRRFFDYLDQPVMRVHGGLTAPAVSRILEQASRANKDDVCRRFLAMMVDTGRLMRAAP